MIERQDGDLEVRSSNPDLCSDIYLEIRSILYYLYFCICFVGVVIIAQCSATF